MKKVLLDGRWFDSTNAIEFREYTKFIGSKVFSFATQSYNNHEALFLTQSKRWILERWNNITKECFLFEIQAEQAAIWLSVNKYTQCRLEPFFGVLGNIPGPNQIPPHRTRHKIIVKPAQEIESDSSS